MNRYRNWIPFAGFKSCPVCEHRYVSIRDRMNSVPSGFAPKPCPRCGAELSYPKWAVFVLRLWCMFIAGIFGCFILAFLQFAFAATVFEWLLIAMFPLAGATFVAMCWGLKLRVHH